VVKRLLAKPVLYLWRLLCRRSLRRFRAELKHAGAINRGTLLEILSAGKATAIGRRFNFDDILRSREPVQAFRQRLPVSDYSHFAADIQAIAAGSEDILFPGKPALFVATSGTSSDTKLLPMTRAQQNTVLKYIIFMIPAMREEAAPGLRPGQRSINLMLASNPGNVLPGGARVGMSSAGGVSRVVGAAPYIWCSPASVFQLSNHSTALYLHALFGLQDESAGCIEAIFGSHIVSWMSMVLDQREQLINDIATGCIYPELEIAADERRQLESALAPNPLRAAAVRAAFEQGEAAIIKRLWPNMQVFSTIVSGAFAISLPRLSYLAGDEISIYTTCFGATESMVGINLWPESPERYALSVGAAYYEFLPLADIDSAAPQTVGIEELQQGECYEVLVSSRAGLYRYRLGDVIRIVDFDGNAPVFIFDHRVGTVLDIVGEKTTEQHTRQVVQGMARELLGSAAAVSNYTVTCDTADNPYRYCVYLELSAGLSLPKEDAEKLANEFDRQLQLVNSSYRTLARSNGRLGAAKLKLVSSGTFGELEDFRYVKNPGSSRNQIKAPRALRDLEQIGLLEARVL
jgi:hypothetical protein